jgi:hypothetical protein
LNRAGEVLINLNDGRPTQTSLLKTAERTEFVRAKDLLKSKVIPSATGLIINAPSR